MTSKTHADTRILGSLRSAAGLGIVRIEDRFDAHVDEVWSAVTDPARLSRWYGDVDGDLRPGGEFRLHIPADGWYGVGRVDTCESGRHLRVTTRESDESYRQGEGAAPFDESVDVTVTRDGDGTIVVVEVAGLPLDKIAYYGVGWQIHVESLGRHLAGAERGDTEPRWGDLVPPYLALAAELG